MNPLILAILAAIAVGAAGFALAPALLGDIQANRRNADVARNRDTRRKEIQQTLRAQTAVLEKRKKRIPLQDQLYQAGMKLKKAAFIRNSVIFGVVMFVVCFVLQLEL